MIKPGKGLLGAAVDEDDPWADRVDRLQRGVGGADTDMTVSGPPAPEADPFMETDDDARLNQAPNYPVEGALPVNLSRALQMLRLEAHDAPSPAYFPPDRSRDALVSVLGKALAEKGFVSGFRPSENVIDRRR